MTKPRLLSRERIAEHQRVRCGIGHESSADVFRATYQHRDMDGDPLKPFTVESDKRRPDDVREALITTMEVLA